MHIFTYEMWCNSFKPYHNITTVDYAWAAILFFKKPDVDIVSV